MSQTLEGDGGFVADTGDPVLLAVQHNILSGSDLSVDGIDTDTVAVIPDLLGGIVAEDDEHARVLELLYCRTGRLDLILVNNLHRYDLLFVPVLSSEFLILWTFRRKY